MWQGLLSVKRDNDGKRGMTGNGENIDNGEEEDASCVCVGKILLVLIVLMSFDMQE